MEDQNNKQKKLLIAFGVILVLIGIIWWFGYFRKPSSESGIIQNLNPQERQVKRDKIKINLNIFNNPIFDELEKVPEPVKMPDVYGKEEIF